MEKKFDCLCEILRGYKRPLLALSGGCDSSFLAYAFSVSGVKVDTLTFNSTLMSDEEIKRSVKYAKDFDLAHTIIDLKDQHLEKIANNPVDRCYHCKRYLFEQLVQYAKEHSFDDIVEGTNASDSDSYRPGRQALAELHIKSPLKDAGLTKPEIRQIAQNNNLNFAHDASFACFATRFPYNSPIIKERVLLISEGEKFLKQSGYHNVRIRLHGDLARLELDRQVSNTFVNSSVCNELCSLLISGGLSYVTLDLEGFTSGSMDKKVKRS